MSNRVVPHKPVLHERFRLEQVSNISLVIAAPMPIIVGTIASKWPSERDSFAARFIAILAVEYLLVLLAVGLVLSLRRLKFGPREDDSLLLIFIAMTTFLATILLAHVMILGLPLATLGLGVYNICVAERKIRDLKLTIDETDMST